MNVLTRWTWSVAALAAVAPLAVTATSASAAPPLRTAITSHYTTATYLQHALGLPASDTSPAIEPVTYDRFQWLLQQPGRFAILIGDSAEDASFAARARDVELAATAAGAKTVYWFDPNLSGSAQVGDVSEPNLDIRNPAGITSLAPASRTIYGNAWLNLVGQYLGDGVTATAKNVGMEKATVTAQVGTSTINDAGRSAGQSTEVGDSSGGALYDYSGGSAPATVGDSFFLVYDKDRTQGGQPAKIAAWTDLTTAAGSSAAQADVTSAIGTATLSALDQFAWWRSEVDGKQVTQAPAAASGGDVPVLSDADAGWRIQQITYPELVDLLRSETSADAVILFGGTWCPNTRPVLPAINRAAQQNDVQVFNFDTVLDGGTVGGTTTSATNPLQTRNTAANGATANANPSFLYGDLVSRYLRNLHTQYDPAGSQSVSYVPGGDPAGTATRINKLQVPYLIGYRGDANGGPNGVARQWIIDNQDGTFTEYMSSWSYTNPQPNELGITTIPLDAPIWSTLNAQLAHFDAATDPTTLYPDTAVDDDDASYLVAADTATVKYTAAGGGSAASVSVSSGGASPIGIGPAALSAALSALGGAAPANLAGAKAALIAAETAAPPDATLIANLSTVVGAWGVAQQRKTKVIGTWGSATSPASVAGGVAAVHALDVFFGGLPGGVLSTRRISADPVAADTPATIAVTIANDYGRVPTGNLSLVVRQGGTPVAMLTSPVVNGGASFTLPLLAAGSYDYSVSYAGDDQLLAFTDHGTLTIVPAPDRDTPTPPTTTPPTPPPATTVPPVAKRTRVKAGALKGRVTKAPTHAARGRYAVTIAVPKGRAAATGTVTLKLVKGRAHRTIRGRLVRGTATLTLPKLARGTWKATISWAGDARYLAATRAGASIKVSR